jgi:hypothetical protein
VDYHSQFKKLNEERQHTERRLAIRCPSTPMYSTGPGIAVMAQSPDTHEPIYFRVSRVAGVAGPRGGSFPSLSSPPPAGPPKLATQWRRGHDDGETSPDPATIVGFLIGCDGSWHLMITVRNAYSAPKWLEIWASRFECHSGMAKATMEIKEERTVKTALVLAGSTG